MSTPRRRTPAAPARKASAVTTSSAAPTPAPTPTPTAAAAATTTRTRDAARSREAILLAARDEFAGHGLGGARVERIADRAGVNKKLLYHYFADKDDLFRAVMEEAYGHIRQAEQALHLDDLPPAEAIRRLTAFTWDYYLAHPEFLTLLNSENLHQARHVRASTRARTLNSPLIQTLGQILERGRAEGVFRDGVDALQLYISIAGLSYFYLSNRHTLAAIFDRDLMSEAARAERLAHSVEVVLGYLARR